MKRAIVGHAADKFTRDTQRKANSLLSMLVDLEQTDLLISGGCHLGGIDIWAEEYANAFDVPKQIFLPNERSWGHGYKPRNIQIAEACDELHCIVVARYPDTYTGSRFLREGLPYCYHCNTTDHVKSGGCWTMHYARKLGKPGILHII